MKRATERQKYILELAESGRLRYWTEFDSWKTSIIQYGLPRDEQNPTRPEGKKLLDLGWISLVENRANYTENTKTGERIYDCGVVLTPAGKAALEGK